MCTYCVLYSIEPITLSQVKQQFWVQRDVRQRTISIQKSRLSLIDPGLMGSTYSPDRVVYSVFAVDGTYRVGLKFSRLVNVLPFWEVNVDKVLKFNG